MNRRPTGYEPVALPDCAIPLPRPYFGAALASTLGLARDKRGHGVRATIDRSDPVNQSYGRYGELDASAWQAIGNIATTTIQTIGGSIASGQQASAAKSALLAQQAKARAAAAQVKAEQARLAQVQQQINTAQAIPQQQIQSGGGSDMTPILIVGLAAVAAVAIVAWPRKGKRGRA